METTIKAAIIAFAIMAVLWFIRGILLTPVKLGKNQRLTLFLSVSGSSPELEGVINSLNWLIDNGVICGDVILRLETDDPETLQQANLLLASGRIKNIERGIYGI